MAYCLPYNSSAFAVKIPTLTNSKCYQPQNPSLRYSKALSFNRSYARKLCVVKATTLQEDEEKVVVEDSFPMKQQQQHIDDEVATKQGELPETSSTEKWVVKLEKSINIFLTLPETSSTEKWVVKLEKSINIFLTDTVIQVLDALYHDRDYARFFVLETIARVPYFSFISVLHMYESFGWWRRADYLKVHFAESWNEMHHLLIMEELGGNARWFDRVLAQNTAFVYYFMTVVMYIVSPRMAYHFSECVENHAYETYDKFIKAKGEELKEKPAPEIAVKYYTGDDLYLFDEFQTSRKPESRRPKIENLYDVFMNIRDDEAEHCKTMRACQTHGNLQSPHSNPEFVDEDEPVCIPDRACEGIVDCITKSVVSTKAKES